MLVETYKSIPYGGESAYGTFKLISMDTIGGPHYDVLSAEWRGVLRQHRTEHG